MKFQARRTAMRPPRRVPEPPAGIQLGRAIARQGQAFRVRVGGFERELSLDAAVDPALLDEAIASGARVVVEGDVIVGALTTARAVLIGRDGGVDAQVARFQVTAKDELTLRSAGAFVLLRGGEVELFGNRVLTRARELVKLLGRMVKVN